MGNLVKLKPGERGNAGLTAAHGVLHLLRPVDMAKLCHMEHEYRPTELVAELYDGRTVRAIAYCSPPETCIQNGLPPPDRYVKLLCEGAREFKLEPSFTQWLHSLEIVPTRQRGDPYWQSPDGRTIKARQRSWVGDPKQNSNRGGRGGRRGGRRGGNSNGGRGRGHGQGSQ